MYVFHCVIISFLCSRVVSFSLKITHSRSDILLRNALNIYGYAGGVAECIAYKLSSTGVAIHTILNKSPISNILREELKMMDALPLSAPWLGNPQSQSANILLVTDDNASQETTLADFAKLGELMENMSLASVVGIFRERITGESVKLAQQNLNTKVGQYCKQKAIPYIELSYDTLIGGVPGVEPLPFVSMPLKEPRLHPTFILQTVVCNINNTGENGARPATVCTRDGVAELVSQLTKRLLLKEYSPLTSRSLRVHSVAGPPLIQQEWDALIDAMFSDNRHSLAELARVDLSSIMKPQGLLTWVCDSWFPQAAAEGDASRTFSAARPVRAVQTGPAAVSIYWEEILPNLTVRPAGTLQVLLNGVEEDGAQALGVVKNRKSITVVRSVSTTTLPGEVQLARSLEEAVKKLALKKQVCKL